MLQRKVDVFHFGINLTKLLVCGREIGLERHGSIQGSNALGLSQLRKLGQSGAPGALPSFAQQRPIAFSEFEVGQRIVRIGCHGAPRRPNGQVEQGGRRVVGIERESLLKLENSSVGRGQRALVLSW